MSIEDSPKQGRIAIRPYKFMTRTGYLWDRREEGAPYVDSISATVIISTRFPPARFAR